MKRFANYCSVSYDGFVAIEYEIYILIYLNIVESNENECHLNEFFILRDIIQIAKINSVLS